MSEIKEEFMWRDPDIKEIKVIKDFSSMACNRGIISIISIAAFWDLLLMALVFAVGKTDDSPVKSILASLFLTIVAVGIVFFIIKSRNNLHDAVMRGEYKVCDVVVIDKYSYRTRSRTTYYLKVKLPNEKEEELITVEDIYKWATPSSHTICIKYNDENIYGYFNEYDVVILPE